MGRDETTDVVRVSRSNQTTFHTATTKVILTNAVRKRIIVHFFVLAVAPLVARARIRLAALLCERGVKARVETLVRKL